MQTRARAGKLQKPSQLLQSSETLARDPLAKNIVISDNSAQRRPGIYDLGPNSTDGIPPPPLPSRRTRKATSNVESTEPVEPARQRKGKSAAPRRQLKASAPQLPPTDLLSRQNLKTVEHQASPDPGQAMQAPSNLDTIEVASSPSPLQASTDLQGPTRQSGSPKPSNVEPAEIPRGSTNQRVNVANSEQIGLIRGLVREVATLDAPILERIEVCSSTSPSALSVDHEPSGPGSPLAAGAAPLDRENLDNIENLRQSASFTAAAAAEENEICAAPESLSAGDFSKDVENDEVQKPPPRKRRTKQRTTVTYPRRPLPEPAASQLRAIWQQRWGEKPNIVTSEDKLRVEFWGNGDSKPRCYSCRKGLCQMLPDELAPDGTEERELLPCGCLYDAAMLEMWCVKKGMFVDAELKREKLDPNVDWVEHLGPKTFGKHKLLLLRFWEMMFGPFNCQTLFNLHGARVNAVWQFSELETQALAQFGPNPGYVQLEKPPRARPKRKRDAVPVNPAL